jgi:hypothetical protein
MSDFKTFFENQALEDFIIDVDDFILQLDINEFINDLDKVTNKWTELNKLNKAIEALENQLDEIQCMIQNPEALTKHDRLQIRAMRQYLAKFHGRSQGYYPFRKKYIDNLIEEYQKISIENRMILLTNIDLIEKATNELIDFYKFQKLEKYKYVPEINNKSIDWLKRHYQCECGTIVQHRCKFQHDKSKKHLKYLEMNTCQEIPEYNNKWVKSKYICNCGVEVNYTNKWHHNKTNRHKEYLQKQKNNLNKAFE